jgi:hypothetical protein
MSSSRGRWLPLSVPRRLVMEILRAARGVPAVTVERRLELAELVQARRLRQPRPLWTAILTKAFAVVAAGTPALRRSYFSFPWPRLYEHPEPVACVTLERDYEGEEAVLLARLTRPHARPLAVLDAELRRCQCAPLLSVAAFQRALRLARLPWPLRPLAMWLGLHASGRLRERQAGTFCVSSVAAQGAGALRMISPLAFSLHYGLLDADGGLEMRLTFDHRVLDGATAARALAALEQALRGPVLDELRGPAWGGIAA